MRIAFSVLLCIGTAIVSGCQVVTRGDVQRLAASAPLNSSRIATEICGKPADLMGGMNPKSPLTELPHAELLSWSPNTTTEGTATARVMGIGVKKKWPDEINIGVCECVIQFKYEFWWTYNGRAVVQESKFTEGPVVIKAQQ